jgi:hypothetical protein
VEEVRELKRAILRYDKIVAEMPSSIKSHNDIFNEEFEKVINELFE